MAAIPDEGLCVVCEETVQLRRDGRAVKHPRPYDPDAPIVFTLVDGRPVAGANCGGGGQHPSIWLEMTFARWLRAHHKRRDARTNPVTYLAQRVFQPCTRAPATAVAELSWSTPEELRLLLVRPGINDWLGEYIDQAEAGYDVYLAGVAERSA